MLGLFVSVPDHCLSFVPARDSTFNGKITPPAGSVQRWPQGPTPHAEKVTPVASQHAAELRAQALQQQVKARAHGEEKVALVTSGIAFGLVALWLWSR